MNHTEHLAVQVLQSVSEPVNEYVPFHLPFPICKKLKKPFLPSYSTNDHLSDLSKWLQILTLLANLGLHTYSSLQILL